MTQETLIPTRQDLYGDYPNPHNLSKEEIKLILDTFHFSLMKDMIDTGTAYILPFQLGLLGVFRVGVYGRGVFDYQLYKDTGIKRYHRNNGTNQEVAVFKWIRTFGHYSSKLRHSVYNFKASRHWKRYIAKRMKENNSILSYYYYDN